MADRNTKALSANGEALMSVIKEGQMREVMNLLSKASHVGSGQYNINYKLHKPNDSVVMRVSRYGKDFLQETANWVMGQATFPNEYEANLDPHVIEQCQLHLSMDSVRIKNNISYFTNMLIRENICPHYVYMLGEADVRGFYAYVGEPNPTSQFRRYTNVSLHEAFDYNLAEAMSKQLLSPMQLRCAMFQVIHGIMMLQHHLPGFRHNDMKADNILLKIQDPGLNKNKQNKYKNANADATRAFREYQVYTDDDASALVMVPDVGVFAAISDFDLANAPVSFEWIHESHNMPKTMLGAALVNNMLTKPHNFKDQQAAETLNNLALASFDMYQFLKSMLDTMASNPKMKSTYEEVWMWLNSFQDFKSPDLNGRRYTHRELADFVPLNVLKRGTLFSFAQPKVNPVARYRVKELGIMLRYLGDVTENTSRKELEASGPLVDKNAAYFIQPSHCYIVRLGVGTFAQYAKSKKHIFIEFYRDMMKKANFVF